MYHFTLIVIFTKLSWLEYWEKNNHLPSWVEFIPVLNLKPEPNIANFIQSYAQKAKTNYIVVVNQDVKLHVGWSSEVLTRIHEMNKRDPNWGFLTPHGVTPWGQYVKSVPDYLIAQKIGTFPSPAIASDGMCYIFKKYYADLIDTNYPCIHLIDSDLILSLREIGVRSYIVDIAMEHLITRDSKAFLFKESEDLFESKWGNKLKQPFYSTAKFYYFRYFDKYNLDKAKAWDNVSNALVYPGHIKILTDSLSEQDLIKRLVQLEHNSTYPFDLFLIGNKYYSYIKYSQMTEEKFSRIPTSKRFLDVTNFNFSPGWLEHHFGFRMHPIDADKMMFNPNL